MTATLGQKEFVCDLADQSCLGFKGRDMDALLGLTEFVCGLAEQSWTLKAEL